MSDIPKKKKIIIKRRQPKQQQESGVAEIKPKQNDGYIPLEVGKFKNTFDPTREKKDPDAKKLYQGVKPTQRARQANSQLIKCSSCHGQFLVNNFEIKDGIYTCDQCFITRKKG